MKLNLSESFLVEEIHQSGENEKIMIFEGLVCHRHKYPIPCKTYEGDRPNLNWPAFLMHLSSKSPLQPRYRRVA
jgi:hypothetical protein